MDTMAIILVYLFFKSFTNYIVTTSYYLHAQTTVKYIVINYEPKHNYYIHSGI